MQIHDLKCWPVDFAAIMRGEKTHDARRDDRGFSVDDVLRLHEWTPDDPSARDFMASGKKIRGTYTGRTMDVVVTYITRGQYGLPPDLAVMSIKRESK